MEKDASDEKSNRLVLNVMDKKKYVLHISALKFLFTTWIKVLEKSIGQ